MLFVRNICATMQLQQKAKNTHSMQLSRVLTVFSHSAALTHAAASGSHDGSCCCSNNIKLVGFMFCVKM